VGKEVERLKSLNRITINLKKKHIKVQKRRVEKSHKQKIMTCGL
jgi:hypothetical protein